MNVSEALEDLTFNKYATRKDKKNKLHESLLPADIDLLKLNLEFIGEYCSADSCSPSVEAPKAIHQTPSTDSLISPKSTTFWLEELSDVPTLMIPSPSTTNLALSAANNIRNTIRRTSSVKVSYESENITKNKKGPNRTIGFIRRLFCRTSK